MEITHRDGKVEVLSGADFTHRWTCRRGEFLIWIEIDRISGKQKRKLRRQETSFFDSSITRTRASDPKWVFREYWALRDGYQVTITDRWQDLPEIIELNAIEFTKPVLKKIPHPNWDCVPTEGVNIWRVPAGGRLIWVTENDSDCPVKAIVNLERCALVVGESATEGIDVFREFGFPERGKFADANEDLLQIGIDLATTLVARLPPEFPWFWKLGL